ncbi:DUF814 domain-containing protein [Candidatus Micrarchaeota archaeon]|nr:DUF814 domain-containing protein [Candidatus Micrarchaeota archaeon]MBU1930668.1 DUF814 domain-containing protein [Candidatus Micrarchaeota archaeon]
MRIEIDFQESLEKNADRYYEQSKKAKKKLAGLKDAIIKLEKETERKQVAFQTKKDSKQIVKKRSRDWFEKFRWFFTSDSLLVIGGRDAKTNDWIVKKFLEKGDLYFHADLSGAPHCVLKTKNNKAPEQSKQEALAFSVVFSRAWQSSSSIANAYWVLPSQVSKKAPSGESMGKGAFMIYGKRNYGKKIPLECGIGIEKKEDAWRIVSGPLSAIQKNALHVLKLGPGEMEKGPLSKKLFKHFEFKVKEKLSPTVLDEIIGALPTGGSKIIGE